jgi:transposase
MTLHPHSIPDVPEVTAQVARAAFRKGNPYMRMRDELGTFFTDEQFSDLFPDSSLRRRGGWRW